MDAGTNTKTPPAPKHIMYRLAKMLALALCMGLVAVTAAAATFISQHFYMVNETVNDRQAEEMRAQVLAAGLPDGVMMHEHSVQVGYAPNAAGEAVNARVTWAGMVVQADMEADELLAALQALPSWEGVQVTPYSHETARCLCFSGVQKDFWDEIPEGLYLVGITEYPPLGNDRRIP